MAKSLHTLIRLHQHRVDEKRRELGGMIAIVSDLERQACDLEEKIINEQDIYGNSIIQRTVKDSALTHSMVGRHWWWPLCQRFKRFYDFWVRI